MNVPPVLGKVTLPKVLNYIEIIFSYDISGNVRLKCFVGLSLITGLFSTLMTTSDWLLHVCFVWCIVKFIHLGRLLALDITPNGSLRRRRSRVPSEEDDSNLMDFLRASGQDAGRERKSWGSLGKN